MRADIFGNRFRDYCPPCFAGSLSLPPVLCRTYTGRPYEGLRVDDLRPGFHTDFAQGRIDAPNHLPAGSHMAPRITINGAPAIERAQVIYPREIEREQP